MNAGVHSFDLLKRELLKPIILKNYLLVRILRKQEFMNKGVKGFKLGEFLHKLHFFL